MKKDCTRKRIPGEIKAKVHADWRCPIPMLVIHMQVVPYEFPKSTPLGELRPNILN